MHTSVRGIVNYNDKIVLIHRIKTKDDGAVRDYYVTPGGKIEENESHEEALRREIKEELGIEIEIKGICLELDDRDYNDSFQYFYNCNYKDGELGTGDGPEFTDKENYKGVFEIVLVDKKEISKLNLVPEKIKEILVNNG
ncbi:MAG: NUDIX domain-containing protein [Clostridiales bacterium]|nr:NUDIX domain-containing protein [Clostridiales bacterium]